MSVVAKLPKLIKIVFKRADDIGRTILEQKFNQVEGLNRIIDTLRIFLHEFFFFNFSQMN